ncbi:hypothetical protein ACO1O0_005353 [Amphichorda felina]
MDFINKVTGGDSDKQSSDKKEESSGGFMDKVNNAAGGGKQGEKNEDALDKAVDMFQDKVLGQGDQSNESAAEQAKDEAISDFIRDKYKETTGKDFFVSDKDKKYGA